VVEAGAATLVCRLDSRALDPGVAWWPWPYVVTATHRVAPGELHLTLSFENLANEPAPLMVGLHPYFPLRFTLSHQRSRSAATGGGAAWPAAADLIGADEMAARQTCQVWVDAGTLWERQRSGGPGALRAVAAEWDVRRPRSLADLAGRAVQMGIASPDGRLPVLLYVDREALAEASGPGSDPAAGGGVASGVVDAASGLRLTLETSRAFGVVALYVPPAHPAVSLEPRSSLPDALALARDDPDLATGLRTVAPGTPWQAWARLSLAGREPG
jgi:hypothetical protein